MYGVLVEEDAGSVVAYPRTWVGVEAASWTSLSGTPASRTALMDAFCRVCAPMGLSAAWQPNSRLGEVDGQRPV